jgi:hypothetical protein
MSRKPVTYRALTRPIPPFSNISNIGPKPADTPCTHCVALKPARETARGERIETSYDRIISYPSFSELKKSALKGCGMCWLLRKTLKAQWIKRPMEEIGVGVLSEKDGLFDDLLDEEWDCKVRISRAFFVFMPAFHPLGDNSQTEGIVTHLTFMVSLLNVPMGDDGQEVYGTIEKTLAFKVYDSAGEALWLPRLTSLPTLIHYAQKIWG